MHDQVHLFVLSKLLSSLWISRTGSDFDWCVLQEALYKCKDAIQYSTMIWPLASLWLSSMLNIVIIFTNSTARTNSHCIHSFNPDISIAPPRVHYYSEALPIAALIPCRI